MRAHNGAGAFAVEIQVADVKLLPRALQLLARGGIKSAVKADLGFVGYPARGVVVGALDPGRPGAEYFFLRDAGWGRDVGNHGGLNEVPFAGFLRRPPAVDHTSFLLTNVNVIED